jgi:ribokinase
MSASDNKLVVVGSSNADIYIEVSSIPKVGETVDGTQSMIGPGGKGSNQAAAASKYLGVDAAWTPSTGEPAPVAFMGKLGTDDHAAMFLRAFADCGIDSTHVERLTDCPTGQAFIILDAKKHNSIIIALGANEQWRTQPETSTPLTAAETRAVSSARAVLLQREIPDAVNLCVARVAHSAGVRCFLDVGGRSAALDTAILPFLAVISLNETELARVAGADVPVNALVGERAAAAAAAGACTADSEPILPAARELLKQGVTRVLLTLGEHGAFVFALNEAGEAVVESSTKALPPPELVDTTGAGDCFRGVFAAAWSVEGQAMDVALRTAAAASAICVSRKGTLPSMPTREEVFTFMKSA